MASNSELEMRWIEAWSDLYELIEQRTNVTCLLPDGRVVDTGECFGWLQNSAYQGWYVKVEASWAADELRLIATRWLP